MGHREQLLEGAKKCLLERGYARTTARDIVAASGTNLASIGYHFGSKDALLTQAMVEALSEWGDEVDQVLKSARQKDPMARLTGLLNGLIASFEAQPNLWKASFEVASFADTNPELKSQIAMANDLAREGLAQIFLDTEDIDVDTKRTVGALLSAILPGVYSQWVMDPQGTPSGEEFARGLKRIAEIIQSGDRR